MLNAMLLQITSPASTVTPTVVDTAKKVVAQAAEVIQNTAPKEDTISLLDMIVKGGVIMIPIGILSLVAFYVIIERIIAISRASKGDKNFMNNIRDFVLNGNMDAARSLCKNTNNPSARMIEKGLSRMGQPIAEIKEAMEDAGKNQVYQLERNLSLLSIVGRIAPMFGFIGTIMGVIKIFYNISLADNISIGLIAGGLYEKMVTSAAGLVVGVIAFAAYQLFSIWVDKIVNRMETGALEFVDLLNEPGK